MPQIDLFQLVIIGMGALSIGLVAYILVMPYLSGEKRADRRFESVSSNKKPRNTDSAADTIAQRRKDVQDTLRDMEQRQKSREKVTTRIRLLRAGFDAPAIHVLHWLADFRACLWRHCISHQFQCLGRRWYSICDDTWLSALDTQLFGQTPSEKVRQRVS